MKNKMQDLRNHLFEAIENLLDDSSDLEIEKIKELGNLAQVIVNSAKVEVDFIKATGGKFCTFFVKQEEKLSEKAEELRHERVNLMDEFIKPEEVKTKEKVLDVKKEPEPYKFNSENQYNVEATERSEDLPT